MAKYFAEINGSNIVQRVIVVESAELAHHLLGGTWVQTYMDIPYSHNYAGIGYEYHPDKQNFSAPQPFPSWTINDDCNWCPPVPYPNDGKQYRWDEDTLSWVEIQFP